MRLCVAGQSILDQRDADGYFDFEICELKTPARNLCEPLALATGFEVVIY